MSDALKPCRAEFLRPGMLPKYSLNPGPPSGIPTHVTPLRCDEGFVTSWHSNNGPHTIPGLNGGASHIRPLARYRVKRSPQTGLCRAPVTEVISWLPIRA